MQTSGAQSAGRNWAEFFWLALALTGAGDSAIRCVVDAFESGEPARRKVVQAACRYLSSEIKRASLEVCGQGIESCLCEGRAVTERPIEAGVLREALFHMNTFLRFVWVLRFAEGYSRDETQRLLGVSQELVDIGTRKSAIDLTCRLTPATG